VGLLVGQVVQTPASRAARGQAQAVVSAREGADTTMVHIVRDIDHLSYELAREEDLAQTVQLIQSMGRRALPVDADIRSQEQLAGAVKAGLAEFGQIDSLIANAGVRGPRPF
jgi:NAD(P)-dependent dehydrogenase (short-subunit alcohol dehydrogenase family)